jgi:pimeloyl-ACP methyl ester carboxylesterase
LLLAHGGSDFARTFDGFAPLVAAGGWRVVSWDHRGHGESEHAALYSWEADVRDALSVLDSTSREPVALVGHSKGAGLLLDLALAAPDRFTRFVNLDGLASARRRGRPQLSREDQLQGSTGRVAAWLDHRREIGAKQRKPGSLEDLARRRGRMNPRLSHEWLCYLVTAGARRDAEGWRWKLDPAMRWGPGPWRPGWILERLSGLHLPMLGIVSRIEEPMGWGATAEELEPFLSGESRVEEVELGHFVHIEAPTEIARRVLEFL